MKSPRMRAIRKITALVPARPTAWARFLDHAEGCPNYRNGQRCPAGERLHDAVRLSARAATP